MVNPWVSLGTKMENFWRRFFGNFVKGDLVEFADSRKGNVGIYYSHYTTHRGTIKLYVFRNITRKGTLLVSIAFIDPEVFKRIKVVKRAEEFRSLSDAIKYLKENYSNDEILY